MNDSQDSIEIHTEPPMDITTEMMSPATTALLANMNVSIASATGGGSVGGGGGNNSNNSLNNVNHSLLGVNTSGWGNDNNDCSRDFSILAGGERQRQPLHAIQSKHNLSNTDNNINIHNNHNHHHHQQQSRMKMKRPTAIMGPNEALYRQRYDSCVTKSIARYITKMSTNLRHGTELLPNYTQMKEDQRREALGDVDLLLERLERSVKSVSVDSVSSNGALGTSVLGGGLHCSQSQSIVGGANNNMNIHTIIAGESLIHPSTQSTLTTNGVVMNLNNETFGSATTLGEHQHYEHNNPNETFGSVTTLGEHQHQHNNHARFSTGNNDSATTLGNNSTLHNNKSFADTTLGTAGAAVDQSVSLLEESMCLLSDDEIGGTTQYDHEEEEEEEEESRFSQDDTNNKVNLNGIMHHGRQQRANNKSSGKSYHPGVAPIEQTRHCQHNANNNHQYPSTASFAPDNSDEIMLESTTPPFSSYKKLTSKRCASNSGKRGLKSRHRSSQSDEEEDDDSFGNFNGIGDNDEIGGSGLNFLQEQDDDVFSCGSPIQRRFSHDEFGVLDYDDAEDDDSEVRDELHALPRNNASVARGKNSGMNNDDEDESASRFSYQDDDHVDFNNGNDDYNDGHYGDDDAGGGGVNFAESQQRTQTQMSQWNTFHNADAEMTSTQLDGMQGEEEEESPVRRRAIRFDGASQKMAGMQSQRRSQRNSKSQQQQHSLRCEEEDMAEEEDEEETLPKKASKKKTKSNAADPIETVRNLCRRAKAHEEQGVDSSLLEEVAPINVRLRDGMHFRMDPLRCRQDKEKNKTSKTAKKKAKNVSIVHHNDKKGNAKSKTARKAASSRARCESSDSEQSLSDPEPSFKDPISDFPSRVAARLNIGLSFLVEKEALQSDESGTQTITEDDTDDSDHSCAVLLSMTARQIICVASKLLIQTIKSTRRHQRLRNKPPSSKRFTPSINAPKAKEGEYLAGGTLIVLRGKEDITQWEVALREFTGMSVLNHAGMQSTLRKLASTAGKCAGFDVVLTTYDAMKSKEVTIPVDSTGCAILGGSRISTGNDDGWLTARDSGTQSGASAPQKCHQLSVLHRMSWCRVIFMDALGRKGFLTKPGTARAQAAVAINAKSRFALFEKEEDDKSKAETKFKDDRRQLRSVITAIHLPERMKLDRMKGSYILDVNKVSVAGEGDRRESLSSGSEEYDYDDSQDENLTEPW